MIATRDLIGQPVISAGEAETIGRVADMIVDPHARRVAGFLVAQRTGLFFGWDAAPTLVLSASDVQAIGPDAVMARHAVSDVDETLRGLPRRKDLLDREVFTQTGRLIGALTDILIDPDGRIVGYALGVSSGARKADRHLAQREMPSTGVAIARRALAEIEWFEERLLPYLPGAITGNTIARRSYLAPDVDVDISHSVIVVADDAIRLCPDADAELKTPELPGLEAPSQPRDAQRDPRAQ